MSMAPNPSPRCSLLPSAGQDEAVDSGCVCSLVTLPVLLSGGGGRVTPWVITPQDPLGQLLQEGAVCSAVSPVSVQRTAWGKGPYSAGWGVGVGTSVWSCPAFPVSSKAWCP
jgi:hypothetical protein